MESTHYPQLSAKPPSHVQTPNERVRSISERERHQLSSSKLRLHPNVLKCDAQNVGVDLLLTNVPLSLGERSIQHNSQDSGFDLFDEFLNIDSDDNEIQSYVENGSVATIRKRDSVTIVSMDHQNTASPGDASTMSTAVSSIATASVATIQQRRMSITNGVYNTRKWTTISVRITTASVATIQQRQMVIILQEMIETTTSVRFDRLLLSIKISSNQQFAFDKDKIAFEVPGVNTFGICLGMSFHRGFSVVTTS
jgi:hypothetical protein